MKRVQFEHRAIPYLFIAPQIIITSIFFLWPSAQAIYQSFLLEDAFGLSSQFVWFRNYTDTIGGDVWLQAAGFTMIFSALVNFMSLALALLLAFKANEVLHGASTYKTLLMWAYAIARPMAGWMGNMMFNPLIGDLYHLMNSFGYHFDHELDPCARDDPARGAAFWPGPHLIETYNGVLFVQGGVMKKVTATSMLQNSLILGLGFAFGKVIISLLAAYAIVYFRFRFGVPRVWVIFMVFLLPLEVRIIPSYEVLANVGLLDTYTGLIVSLHVSATGTFFFRRFFRAVPDELPEAARFHGASDLEISKDILVPLSRTRVAAILIIMFMVGWHQYLWPLMLSIDESTYTVVRGLRLIGVDSEPASR